jgi:S-DNA-T family DNA segregation ATPase FtsK/SpoIIIE
LQSGIDSKTILNATGAEKLLGQGDMIFAPTGTSSTPRLQAAYASDEEIKAVIDYDIKYNKANYDETVNNIINSEQQADTDASSNFNGGDGVPSRDSVDSYFKEAVRLVMQNGGASVSYLQRRLSIGYSRAARIIDQMEDKGYIAGATGSKVRKVLITPDQFYEEFGEAYDNID